MTTIDFTNIHHGPKNQYDCFEDITAQLIRDTCDALVNSTLFSLKGHSSDIGVEAYFRIPNNSIVGATKYL